MTLHQSAIERMQREGMIATAIEALRVAIAEIEEEVTESRRDIDDQLARIRADELYLREQETRLEKLRARLAQMENAETFGVIPHHEEVTHG